MFYKCQSYLRPIFRLGSVASAHYRFTNGYLAIDHVRGVYVLQAWGCLSENVCAAGLYRHLI